MNMETAMKASVTGWKQQVTADHGKGRAAGKANFADTFSEMLKTGKKAAEDRTQSQSARKTPEIQTGSKTDDTGNDTVRAEASGPADTRAEKSPEKKPDTRRFRRQPQKTRVHQTQSIPGRCVSSRQHRKWRKRKTGRRQKP